MAKALLRNSEKGIADDDIKDVNISKSKAKKQLYLITSEK
jgi:hypothetical protein